MKLSRYVDETKRNVFPIQSLLKIEAKSCDQIVQESVRKKCRKADYVVS